MIMNKNSDDLNTYVATRQTRGHGFSVGLVKRIKTAYRLSHELIFGQGNSVLWDKLIAPKKNEIHQALLKDDDSAFKLLSSPDETDLFYGVDNLSKSILINTPQSSSEYGQNLYKLIQRLSEAFGNRRLFNPMGGSMFPEKNREKSDPLESYLRNIDDHIGIPLKFYAPFKNQFGLNDGRYGFITDRSIFGLYQAYRLKNLSEGLGLINCVEIGPGMGRTALYAFQLGLEYTVVDLPLTLVGTSLFLAATVGEANIRMHGEDYNSQTISLMTPTDFYKTNKKYDIAFNSDSLTEMSKENAESYMSNLKKNTKFIYSINHEANDFTVTSLCKKLGIKNLQRSNYWFWEGYAEELYINDRNLKV